MDEEKEQRENVKGMLEELGLGEDRLRIRDQWECGECDKEFRTDRLLYFHVRKQHKNPMSCLQCCKTFSSEVKFVQHKTSVHGVHLKRKHLCPTCGKTFTDGSNFRRHVKSHEVRKVPKQKTKATKRYHCSRCPKHFSHKRSLANHIRSKHRILLHSGSSYNFHQSPMSSKYTSCSKSSARISICPVCNVGFSRSFSMMRHLQRCHGVLPRLKNSVQKGKVTPLSCDSCGFKCKAAQDLQHHMTQHHPLEPKFPCSHCPRIFKEKKILWNHTYRDHRGQTWRCTACDKSFKQKSNLKRHMQIHATPSKAKAAAEQISRRSQRNRLQGIVKKFHADIADFPEADRKRAFRKLVKDNPDVLDTYDSYPLTEDEVIEMIRDAYLSDRQALKICSIIRQKWGRHKITANIKKILQGRKQLLAHLFTVEYLDKDQPGHFLNNEGKPISR